MCIIGKFSYSRPRKKAEHKSTGFGVTIVDAVTSESSRGDIAVTSPGDVTASNGYVTLTDRQHWIVDPLRDDVELTRAMLEEHGEIGLRQAKRELTGLSKRGLIEFKRKPRPGHYVLRQKLSRP